MRFYYCLEAQHSYFAHFDSVAMYYIVLSLLYRVRCQSLDQSIVIQSTLKASNCNCLIESELCLPNVCKTTIISANSWKKLLLFKCFFLFIIVQSVAKTFFLLKTVKLLISLNCILQDSNIGISTYTLND